MFRLLIFLILSAASLSAQSIHYEVPAKPWDASLGMHRVVLQVEQHSDAVRVKLEWRRRDPNPEKKAVIVVDAKTGQRLANTVALNVNSDFGDVVFQPVSGAGEYFAYFLPGLPGGGAFPAAAYVAPGDTADPDWKTKAGLANKTWQELPEAKVERWEGRTEHDKFNEMEIIATDTERKAWLAAHPEVKIPVFPELRERPTRMLDHVPEVWLKRDKAPEFVAQPGEYFVFQLGVWAATEELQELSVRFDEWYPLAKVATICLQTNGAGAPYAQDGRPVLSVPKDGVTPLWCAVDLPTNVLQGRYKVTATLLVKGQPVQTVPLTLMIAGTAVTDRGDSEPWKHTKLRWLNSHIGNSSLPTKPFAPLQLEGNTLRCLGREVTLGPSGLPASINTYFNGSVTKVGTEPHSVLAAPMRFVVELADGRELIQTGFLFPPKLSDSAEWSGWVNKGDPDFTVQGHMEFDGHLEFRCTLSATNTTEIKNVRLEIPRTAESSKLAMGLGLYGDARPESIDWKWDVTKHQDALWLGSVHAGLRIQLRAENYVRPMINIHYPRQPLNDPPSWSGGGKGGVTVKNVGNETVLFTAYSGARTLKPGQPLHFDFDLSITPFKPLDTEAQWRDRYCQGGVVAPETAKAGGANVINIHHGTHINPYINYPFLTTNLLKDYADKVHAAGLRVKYYYTVRELTNWTPELFAFRAFGNELLAPGKGGGHAWCEEHLGGQYWGAWGEPSVHDASILTATMSRFNNLYLEGLRWLINNAGCDGIYLDDISFDRTVTKRARRILDENPRGPGLIDLHSWNELNERAGFASCSLIFMDSFPFIDRLWIGEGHSYEADPEQILVGVSGIPFGLMSEMLEGGGNAWLGLTYGMTGRFRGGPAPGDPREIWKLWDDFGVAGSEFIGWWDPACPVKADNPDCRATIWMHKGKTLIAVGNFGDKAVRTKLNIDFATLGLDPKRAQLYAPEMKGFQPELLFANDAAIGIAPKRGFAFILDETPRNVAKATDPVTFDAAKLIFEDTFAPQPKAGWNISAKSVDSVKPDKEGLVFLAPANAHAWAERVVPESAAVISAQIRQDVNDTATHWGPGLTLVWADGKFIKASRRQGGLFGLSINGQEKLTGMVDGELPVTLVFQLEKEMIRILAIGAGVYEQTQELAKIPRTDFPAVPTTLRIGKLPNNAQPHDDPKPGAMGWSRCDWVRVYGE